MCSIENQYIKSPLNYTGGKFKLLPQIISLFPKRINTFVDLFGGGFNIGINAEANKVIYNDLCLPVVKIMEHLHKTATEDSLHMIDHLIEKYELSKTNRGGYLELRNIYNSAPHKSSIILYTLICYSFNNQIRFNSKGEYNMPFGKDRSSFNPSLREKFIRFSNELQDNRFVFSNSDFREFQDMKFSSDDFIYCDPPYYNSTASYNENNGWAQNDESDLLKMLKYFDAQGVKWALSNNFKTNPELLKWANENDYNIHYLNADYTNCNYQKKDKSKDVEVLMTNY